MLDKIAMILGHCQCPAQRDTYVVAMILHGSY